MMDEVVAIFKVEFEALMEEMYQKLGQMVDDAMFNTSFCEGDPDENYEKLDQAMNDIIREVAARYFGEEESN